MCTSPPNKFTHPPNFSVSIGQVSFPDGGQGFFDGDGFGVTGGNVTGGNVTGGRGGRSTGGLTGGRSIGGLTMGGRVIGGLTAGGRSMGGLTMGGREMGGRVMGPLGDFEPEPGLVFLGGLEPQEPQPKIGVAVERKSMEMRKRE